MDIYFFFIRLKELKKKEDRYWPLKLKLLVIQKSKIVPPLCI